MEIIRAVPADAAALTAIAFAAKRHWGYPEAWIQRWADLLTITADAVRARPTFGAREEPGSEFVGFATLDLGKGGGTAQLDHLWVLPAAMGRGIGRALFEHAEQHARTAGAMRLAIEGDPHAEGFYVRMGAQLIGWVPAPMDGQARRLPLLEKQL